MKLLILSLYIYIILMSISHLASWLRTRRFSEPTFRPSGATNHWKNIVNRDFPTFSRICIFFLLTLSLLLFSLLIFLFSLTLSISAFHLSILSEVWLLYFLRLLYILYYIRINFIYVMCVWNYLPYIYIYYTYVLYIYSGLLCPLDVPEFLSLKVPLLPFTLPRYESDRSLVGWRWTVLGSYRAFFTIQPTAMEFYPARSGI